MNDCFPIHDTLFDGGIGSYRQKNSVFKKILITYLGITSLLTWKQIFYNLARKQFHFLKIVDFVGEARFIANYLRRHYVCHIDDRTPVFYSYWFNQNALALSILKKRCPYLKVISRAHGLELYYSEFTKPYLNLMSFCCQTLDSIVSISQHGEHYLRQHFLCKNVVTSYLGVVDNHFLTKISNENELFIVSCSFIYPVKRLQLLIEHLALFMRTTSLKVRWMHLGGSQFAMDESKLRSSAETLLGGIHNLEWSISGKISNHDILNYYKTNTVDVLINVSESEGLPVSMMEALSFGIPIIGTDVGGTCELVNEDTGVLIPKDFTHDAFSDALKHILTFKTIECRQKIRDVYLAKFSAERNYQSFVDGILMHKG